MQQYVVGSSSKYEEATNDSMFERLEKKGPFCYICSTLRQVMSNFIKKSYGIFPSCSSKFKFQKLTVIQVLFKYCNKYLRIISIIIFGRNAITSPVSKALTLPPEKRTVMKQFVNSKVCTVKCAGTAVSHLTIGPFC